MKWLPRSTQRSPRSSQTAPCSSDVRRSRTDAVRAQSRRHNLQQAPCRWVQCAAHTAGAGDGPCLDTGSSGAASSLSGSEASDGVFVAAPQMHASQAANRDGNGAAAQGGTTGDSFDGHSAGMPVSRTQQRSGAVEQGAEASGRHVTDSWLRSRHDGEIFRLAIPALAAVMLDPLMGLVDTAIVGRLGAAQLGAVGLATVRRTRLSMAVLLCGSASVVGLLHC